VLIGCLALVVSDRKYAPGSLGALAHLGVARAMVSSGDIGKAKPAHGDFFAAWKGADADVPILKLARAEFAKRQ
jgi:hypothetical protein